MHPVSTSHPQPVWVPGAPGMGVRMGWEESMAGLFEDLEQQAEGLGHLERDAEVAELSAAEYAQVSFSARVHGSLGRQLRVRFAGGHLAAGRLVGVGQDWMLLAGEEHEWLVRHASVQSLSGASDRARSEETWSLADRLSLRAMLRRLSAEFATCVVHFDDGRRLEGRVGRVGRDFMEFHAGQDADRSVQIIGVQALAALHRRP